MNLRAALISLGVIMETRRVRGGRVRRSLFIALGTVAVGLGLLGIVVPGLPTTVFLLVASYFFARSSPRLHRRLLNHPRFGPYLELASQRTMSLRAKAISLLAMWAGVALSCMALADSGPAAPIIVVSLGVAGTAVLLFYVRTLPAAVTIPTRRS